MLGGLANLVAMFIAPLVAAGYAGGPAVYASYYQWGLALVVGGNLVGATLAPVVGAAWAARRRWLIGRMSGA